MLRQYRAAFENVTDSTVPELLHRPSGLRCRYESHYSIALNTQTEAGRELGYCAMSLGGVGVWTEVARVGDERSVRDSLMDFATTEVTNAWIDRDVRYAGRPARLGRLRYQTAGFAEPPKVDARDEEYRRVNAVEIDGWILSQVTVGRTVDREAVDAAAAAAWERLVTTRVAGVPLRESAAAVAAIASDP
jgi:hypothetical protein